jgi:hypothetical protein
VSDRRCQRVWNGRRCCLETHSVETRHCFVGPNGWMFEDGGTKLPSKPAEQPPEEPDWEAMVAREKNGYEQPPEDAVDRKFAAVEAEYRAPEVPAPDEVWTLSFEERAEGLFDKREDAVAYKLQRQKELREELSRYERADVLRLIRSRS